MSGMSSLPRRTNKLSPPSLSLSYDCNQDNKFNCKYSSSEESTNGDTGYKFSQKGGSKSKFSIKSSDSGFEELHKGETDINLKNHKNKLNLQFAPDKMYKPTETDCSENKISKEINGNLNKNNENHISVKSKLQFLPDTRKNEDEDDSSRSGSEISVLELSSFIDVKENEKGNGKSTEDNANQGEWDFSAVGTPNIYFLFNFYNFVDQIIFIYKSIYLSNYYLE